MSDNSCPDLCSVQTCEELAARIGALEQHIALLEASFEAHTLATIPEAHQYTPQVTVNVAIGKGDLIVDVTVDGQSDFSSVPLPTFEPFVTFDIFPVGNNIYEFQVSVNGDSDSDTLDLSSNENLDIYLGLNSQNELEVSIQVNGQSDYDSVRLPNSNVSVDFFNNNDRGATLKVQVGNDSDEDYIYFPETNSNEHVVSNLKLNGSYQNDILTLTIADGESFDTVQIPIDADIINNFGGGSSVSCDGLSQEFQDCCSQILSAIAANLAEIIEVKQSVTIDVSSTVCSDYECEFSVDENDQPILTYAEAKFTEKQFEGVGIEGLNQRLIYLAKNQDAMYKDICRAIDPIRTISKNDFYQFCLDGGIDRNDYDDTPEGTELYDAAVEIYLTQLVAESKYGYLLNVDSENNDGVILSAPASYINHILTDFALIQARNNNKSLCAAANVEPVDVVSVVASPKVITNVAGKVLILHFVTLDNYPKRKPGSYPRAIQIPAAKEEYEWDIDFKDLRWVQGNQYGELTFEGYKQKVSGWFKDEESGNAYFDAVLGLTTATQKNRNFPKLLNPRTDIVIQETRPHRAFIESVNSQGRAICHVKYTPLI